MSDPPKRRRWTALAGLTIVAVGLLIWWLAGRPGAPSSVVKFLPAEGITAALFIDDPVDLLLALEERLADRERGILRLDALEAELNFQPREAEAWERIGVDERSGVAAILYEPMGTTPIVLVDVDDEARFYEWMNARFETDVQVPSGRRVTQLDFKTMQFLVGKRGPFTAITRAGAQKRAVFERFIEADGGLLAEPAVLRAFLEAKTRPRLVAFARTRRLVDLFEARSPWIRAPAAMFPTVKGFLDDAVGGVRFDTTQTEREWLRQRLELPVPPPTFSRLVPKNWSALRLSMSVPGLKQLVDRGLADMRADPSRGEPSGWLPYIEGLKVVLDRFGDRFTGHMVIAASNESLSRWLARPDGAAPDWVVLAHLREAGTEIPKGKLPAATRSMGEVLAFSATPAGVEQLRPRPADAPAAELAMLDEPGVIVGLAVETAELLQSVRSTVPPGVLQLFESSELARKAQLSVGFAWDGMGIASRGDAGVLLATAGLAALILAPGASERRRRRQEVEARVFLERIAQGAIDAWRRPLPGAAATRRWPKSVPLTPAEPVTRNCRGYPARPQRWDHPGWRALGFSIYGAHRFQYAFESTSKGFTARAIGDLDCDGVATTMELQGRVKAGEVLLKEGGPARP